MPIDELASNGTTGFEFEVSFWNTASGATIGFSNPFVLVVDKGE
jgi:hypothetical protein